MIEASGGVVNFIAILIPTLMALYYGFRCLFQTEAAIAEWGIGAASEQMVKICGCYALTQGVMYAIILLTSPAGAWEVKKEGVSSAELMFQIYEDGSTAGRLQINKGMFSVGYNMSVETTILLQAYLIYMRDLGSKEFNVGVMSDEEVLDLFD